MIRLVTRGRFTKDYASRLVAAPEDREPAVRKLIEGSGGKLLNFYFTTGDSDFLAIAEANDAESVIGSLLAAAASGMISDVTTAELGPVRNSRQSRRRLPKWPACTGPQARADCRRRNVQRIIRRDQ
jgi:uncharacterized protein with GYD domain